MPWYLVEREIVPEYSGTRIPKRMPTETRIVKDGVELKMKKSLCGR